MARRPATFLSADITRTIKGVMAAGVAACIIVDPRSGTIKIEPIVERESDPPDRKRPIVL
jgi:hypothetical protein